METILGPIYNRDQYFNMIFFLLQKGDTFEFWWYLTFGLGEISLLNNSVYKSFGS